MVLLFCGGSILALKAILGIMLELQNHHQDGLGPIGFKQNKLCLSILERSKDYSCHSRHLAAIVLQN